VVARISAKLQNAISDDSKVQQNLAAIHTMQISDEMINECKSRIEINEIRLKQNEGESKYMLRA